MCKAVLCTAMLALSVVPQQPTGLLYFHYGTFRTISTFLYYNIPYRKDSCTYFIAENQLCSMLRPLQSVGDHHIMYNQEQITQCVSFPAYPYSEVPHKQPNNCGPGIAALTKCLCRLSSFNRQNVLHNGLSWPFCSSVISKCTLSRVLLLHTIEKSQRGDGCSLAGLQQRFICSWSGTNKQTNWRKKKNYFEISTLKTFDLKEETGSDSGTLRFWKRIPSNMKAAFSPS